MPHLPNNKEDPILRNHENSSSSLLMTSTSEVTKFVPADETELLMAACASQGSKSTSKDTSQALLSVPQSEVVDDIKNSIGSLKRKV